VRILLVHNHYQQKGGEDAVVANEKALLEQSGHTVESLTAHNSAISGLVAKLNAFRNVVYNDGVRRTLAECLKRSRPDVVHVHNTFPLLSPSVYDACAEAAVPVVQTLHNFRIFCAGTLLLRNGNICELCLDGRPYRAVVHRCYRDSIVGSLAAAKLIAYHNRHRTWSNKVTRFIALSAFARNKFIDAGLPSDRIVVKPNFVIDAAPPASRHREGILFVGRLSHEKGVSHLIRALSGTDVQLRILGDGPERAALEAQASTNVIFEGGVPPQRVREAMRAAKILVQPSICFENFPLSVVEAFANSLPVIASRLGSLAEIVDDNVMGRLVSPADPAALRAAITELLDEPERLRAMSLAARHRYENLYTPERNINQLLAVYNDAIREVKSSLKL
jgi:glycosyltransferase involved in cell wall biosynthesis